MGKYYVENGEYKKIYDVEDQEEAAHILVSEMIEDGFGFAPFVFVSERGHRESLISAGMEDSLDESFIAPTHVILDNIGATQLSSNLFEFIMEQNDPNTIMFMEGLLEEC